jgi:dihydroflavonol-4-reductase
VAQHDNAPAGTILVTGGTGFIGRYCVQALRESGARLRLLCRNAEKARQLFGPETEVIVGDLQEPATLARACAGVHTIYNLAGSYEFGPAHRAMMWRTNVDGTEHLLDAAWKARVERVIHCSTGGILAAPGRLITASDIRKHPPMWCHYKQSKWHSEMRALDWAKRGLPVVIVSPTAPIGAGDERPTPTGRMFLDLLRGKFPACPHTGLNIVHAKDVAAGILAAAERGQSGQRYVFGNENIWLHDLMALAAREANCAAPRYKVPWLLVAAAGLAGELWGRVGGNNGRLCWETAYFAGQQQFFDLQHSFDTLGWRPLITLQAAVADSVRYFATSAAHAAAGRAVPGSAPLPP